MKGLLFTELLEMVEENFGYRTASAILLNAPLSSKGIYTATKNYHRYEMSVLFERLQKHTQLSFEHLTQVFGRHLCKRLLIAYPQQRGYVNRLFAAITRRADMPLFSFACADSKTLTILYNPACKTNCITEGIIHGYLDHLRQLSRLQESVLPDGRKQFVLSLN